jgi:hypothetical protein
MYARISPGANPAITYIHARSNNACFEALLLANRKRFEDNTLHISFLVLQNFIALSLEKNLLIILSTAIVL